MQKMTHLERKNYTYYAQLCTIISYQLSELLLSAQFYLCIPAIIGQVKCTSDAARAEIKSKKVWHYRGSRIDILYLYAYLWKLLIHLYK